MGIWAQDTVLSVHFVQSSRIDIAQSRRLRRQDVAADAQSRKVVGVGSCNGNTNRDEDERKKTREPGAPPDACKSPARSRGRAPRSTAGFQRFSNVAHDVLFIAIEHGSLTRPCQASDEICEAWTRQGQQHDIWHSPAQMRAVQRFDWAFLDEADCRSAKQGTPTSSSSTGLSSAPEPLDFFKRCGLECVFRQSRRTAHQLHHSANGHGLHRAARLS